jgi:signal recognition particle receptor subunit alpha
VAYQRILQLTYVDELLAALKTLFVQLFQPFLAAFVASLHAASTGKISAGGIATTWDFGKAFERWDKLFDDVLRGLENKATQVCICLRDRRLSSVSFLSQGILTKWLCRNENRASSLMLSNMRHLWTLYHFLMLMILVSNAQIIVRVIAHEHSLVPVPSDSGATTVDEEQIARNVQALKNRLKARGRPIGGAGKRRPEAGSGRDSLPTSEFVPKISAILTYKLNARVQFGHTYPEIQEDQDENST